MISGIQLKNMKCFLDESFDFGNLTLLTGINGAGKSTILQALLLLRQSLASSVNPNSIHLNGEWIQLGTGADILSEDAEEDRICLTLFNELDDAFEWAIRYKADFDVLLCDVIPPANSSIYQESLFTSQFTYLSADRWGPQDLYPVSNYQTVNMRQMGTKGEYAPHFLDHYSTENASLKLEVEKWLGYISPGVRINLKRQLEKIALLYSYATPGYATKDFQAKHVGFGISYTLAIVTALVSANAGHLICIENPEAHLHPAAQVKLAELMAQTAAKGVQIIVETHSDHILNGIRASIHQKSIESAKVSLYYLGRDAKGATVDRLHIDKNGRIDRWPEGFFDAYEKSLDILLAPSAE